MPPQSRALQVWACSGHRNLWSNAPWDRSKGGCAPRCHYESSTCPIQYGKQYPGGCKRKDYLPDALGRPNPAIQSIQATLLEQDDVSRGCRRISSRFFESFNKGLPKTNHSGYGNGILYHASYLHQHHSPAVCAECSNHGQCDGTVVRSETTRFDHS